MDEVASGVRVGDLLAGKYRIEKILGAGGMGVVVAAHHVDLDEKVAIKFLLPEALNSQEAVARFTREARAAVKIKSEHVAKVTDVGKLENGAPYMVMEHLQGSDLAGWLQRMGALAVEQAVEFVLQASEAIAEAHALGIIHRDLKPANLFVIRRPDGALSVKVLDFGISKTTSLVGSDRSGSITKTAALVGSPLYMSPEQMQSSKDLDARSDIWALGVILYELLAGASPFTAENMPQLVLKVVSEPPSPLRAHCPDVPEGLSTVILKCLEKDRGRRFQTVGELGVALLPFAPKRAKISVERISGVMRAAGLSASALALPPSSEKPSELPAGAGTAASWGRTTARKNPSRTILAGIGAVAALGGVASYWRVHASRAALSASASQSPAAAASGENSEGPERAVAASGEPSAPRLAPTASASLRSSPAEGQSAPPGSTSEPPSAEQRQYEPAKTCVPGTSRCTGSWVAKCGARGRWENAVPCPASGRCRAGVCEASAAPPSQPQVNTFPPTAAAQPASTAQAITPPEQKSPVRPVPPSIYDDRK
jgi:serine/threonine-protein kinase